MRYPYVRFEATVTLLKYNNARAQVRDADGSQTLPGGHPLVFVDGVPLPFCTHFTIVDNRGLLELELNLKPHDQESMTQAQAFIVQLGSEKV